jgi:hypothetical protein
MRKKLLLRIAAAVGGLLLVVGISIGALARTGSPDSSPTQAPLPVVSAPTSGDNQGDATETPEPTETETPEPKETETPAAAETQSPEGDQGEDQNDQGDNQDDQGEDQNSQGDSQDSLSSGGSHDSQDSQDSQDSSSQDGNSQNGSDD